MPGLSLDDVRADLPDDGQGNVGAQEGNVYDEEGNVDVPPYNKANSKASAKANGKANGTKILNGKKRTNVVLDLLAQMKDMDTMYLDVPISLAWATKAHFAGGSSLIVLLLLLREARLKGKLRIQLSGGLRKKLGLTKPAIKRAYESLETRQMIRVDPPSPGKSPWVTLLIEQWPIAERDT
jgi:hypothetical protein